MAGGRRRFDRIVVVRQTKYTKRNCTVHKQSTAAGYQPKLPIGRLFNLIVKLMSIEKNACQCIQSGCHYSRSGCFCTIFSKICNLIMNNFSVKGRCQIKLPCQRSAAMSCFILFIAKFFAFFNCSSVTNGTFLINMSFPISCAYANSLSSVRERSSISFFYFPLTVFLFFQRIMQGLLIK